MEIKNPNNFVAGSELIISLSKKSTCGKDLKIFQEEIQKLSLNVNEEPYTKELTVKEVENSFEILLIIKNIVKVGTTNITGYWSKKPIKTLFLNVLAGKYRKFRICRPDIGDSNIISDSAKISKKFFEFDICVSDKYLNTQSYDPTYLEDLIKVQYPENIIPKTAIKYTSNKDKSIYTISIPTLRIGTYEIFNRNFFGENIKLLKVIGDYPDYKTSFGEIDNYLENRITKPNSQVYLNLFLKDSAGNQITNEEVKRFNCTFKDSIVTHISSQQKKDIKLGEYSLIDNIPTLYYSPKETGEYIFKPKMTCKEGQESSDISCKDCKFYITNSEIDKNFKIFSDYYDEYFDTSDFNGKDSIQKLIISMEEEMNNKITTLLIEDESGVPIQISDLEEKYMNAFKKLKVSLKDQDKNQISIKLHFNPSNGIEIYTSEKEINRNKIFSSLKEYSLSISLEDKLISIKQINVPIVFRYRDDFMNNVNNLDKNDFPKNFIVEYMPESFNINAGNEQYLLRIIPRNNKKEITLGEKLDCKNLEMTVKFNDGGKETDMKIQNRCFKSDIFLHQMASFNKKGSYNIEVTYKSDKIFSINNLLVNARPEIDYLTFDNKNTLIKSVNENHIKLNDIKVGEKFSFEMDIYDAYGNKIDKYINGLMGQLTIENTGKGSVIEANDGSILLSGNENKIGTYHIKIQVHSNTYVVEWTRFSEEIDVINTGASLYFVDENNVQKENSKLLSARIFPFDKFNYQLNLETLKKIKENTLKKMEIYVSGPDGNLIDFDFVEIGIFKENGDDYPYYEFKSNKKITIFGEYRLYAFYDDIAIDCQVCYRNFEPSEKIIRMAKTKELFLINYKTFTRISNEENRYEIFQKLNNFPFFIIYKDEFGNEITNYPQKYDFGLFSENDDEEIARFCKTNVEQRERQYFEICKDYLKKVEKLLEGNYYIAINKNSEEKYKIRISKKLDNSEFNSLNPPSENSYVSNNGEVIEGRLDQHVTIVIDLRNEYNDRYANINDEFLKSLDIKLKETEKINNAKFLEGPHKGLITILVEMKEAVNTTFDIYYKEKIIIKDYKISINEGNPKELKLLSQDTKLDSNFRYNIFSIGTKGKNFDKYTSTLGNNLLTVKEKYNDNEIYHKPNLYYNIKSGKIIMRLNRDVANELIINSFLKGEEIKINQLNQRFNFKNSFAYVDDINDAPVNQEFKIQLSIIDHNYNKINLDNEILNNNVDNFYLSMIYDGYDENDNRTEKLKFINDNGNIYAKIKPQKAGIYYFTAYYNHQEINCSYCRKKIISNGYDLKNTILRVKNGNTWSTKNIKNDYLLYKKNFPIFEIILKDSTMSTYLEKVENLVVELVNEAEDQKIKMQVYYANQRIYSYMNQESRNAYLNLNLKESLRLKIYKENIAEDKIYFDNFILINSEIRTNYKTQCPNEIIPEFLVKDNQNIENNQYLIAGNQAFLEFKLTGCEKEENTLTDNINDFTINVCSGSGLDCKLIKDKEEWKYNIIPSDTFGKYILLIGSDKSIDSALINLRYKNEKINSKNINFEVVSDTDINRVSVTDLKYTDGYVFMYLFAFDKYNNKIKRDSTSCCFRDIFFDVKDLKNNKVIYDLTFKPITNEYIIKLYTNEEKKLFVTDPNKNGKATDVNLNRDTEQNIENSVITFDKFNNKNGEVKSIDIKIVFKNSKYIIQKIKSSEKLKNFIIKFISKDTNNDQIYTISSREITTDDYETFTVIFDENLVFYNHVMIEFMDNLERLTCVNCAFINRFPDYFYSNLYQINKSDTNIYNKDSKLIIRENIDIPLIRYEGRFKDIILYDEKNDQLPQSQYKVVYQQKTTSYISLNIPTDQNKNRKNIKLKIDLTEYKDDPLYKKDIEIPIIILKDESNGNEKFEENETRLSGIRNREFNAGEYENLFIELRDSDLQLTKHEPFISARGEIKFNVIQSICPGIYLIKYTVNKIPNLRNFRIKIDSKEVNTLPNINLKVKRDFPVKMTSSSLHSKNIISERKAIFQLNILDKYDNIVCDYRINFRIISKENMYQYKLNYDNIQNICFIEIYFYGKAQIISPLLGDIKLSIENNNQIYVSQTNSRVVLDSNRYKMNEKIKINTLIGNENKEYVEFENIQFNIKMIIYNLRNNGRKIKVKEINTSSSYTELDTRNFEKEGNYLVKTIVDNIEFSRYSNFLIFKEHDTNSLALEIKQKGKYNWENIKEVYNQMNSLNEREGFKFFPSSLKVRVIDSDNNIISIEKKTEVKIGIIASDETEIKKGYTSIINLSCNTVIIDLNKISLNFLIHLPQGKYYLKISLTNSNNTFNKYIPINIKNGYHQSEEYKYHLPDVNLPSSYEVLGSNGVNTLITNSGSFQTTNICFKFNDKIFNQYIDNTKVKLKSITTDRCDYKTFNSDYRGCIQISISCKSSNNNNLKSVITYNSVDSNNELTILVDHSLPPKNYEIIEEFPDKASQNKNIIATFKVISKTNEPYRYLNSENFEIFDNNSKLKRNTDWKFIAGKDSFKIQLNLPFPPKIHNIRPLFKISNMKYENIEQLNKKISINQGLLNPGKSVISIPINYKSGEELTFPIIMYDEYGNCFEDEVDTNKMKLKIFDDVQSFEGFKFLNKNYTDSQTDSCNSYVEVSANEFNLIKAKKYNIEFIYDQEKIELKNKFEIYPNSLSIEASSITVRNRNEVDVLDIKSGENIEILIQGTDKNGNKVDYREVMERMKIKIGDLSEDEYTHSFTSDEQFIHIFLSITKPGLYKFDILVDNIQFNTKKILTKIKVGNAECHHGTVELNKKNIFIGEYGEIKITCMDKFNNTVSSIEEYENDFKIRIFGKYDIMEKAGMIPYNKNSNKEIITANFLVLFKGEYEILTHLKGVEFGKKIIFNVIDEKCLKETPIMCYQRNCVKSPDECSELVSEHCTKEKPFYCYVNGGKNKDCVEALEDCSCKKDFKYCKGQCIHKNHTNLCENNPPIDCSHLEGTEPCFDGTCKPKGMCGNDIVCPLGFKICGPNCILKDDDCKFEEKKCPVITCWDFSCQNKYENCPTRKVCKNPKHKVCPDGTCAEKAEYCAQPPICPKSFGYLCPDFTCRKSEKDCNIRSVCPKGQALCEDNTCSEICNNNDKCENSKGKYLCKSGICVDNIQLCPTDITCSRNQIRCSNGACVNSIEECEFNIGENKITCPINSPILCSDLSCVDEISKCNISLTNKESCPNNTPYKCPNNECRKNIDECPTQISCPEEFPSLCPDGTCQKANYNCQNRKNVEKYENKANKYLCSNGIFVDSANLCPTQVTCNKGMVKCWDGSCAKSLKQCTVPKNIECQNPLFPYRCHDGECRKKFEDCPTISICPLTKPIKCLDGSCRESIDLCPKVDECPRNYISCPNGTCALPNKCSTLITCPSYKPFMCPSSKKCVNDLRLCPKVKECKGFVCPDGDCISNRLNCMNIAPCSSNSPVRCDKGMCVDKIESCSNEFKCPVGYIVCKSGECKTNEDLCTPEECPVNRPYRCINGECRMNKDQCDTEDGCPASLNTKCKFGTCKKDSEMCEKMEIDFMNSKNKTSEIEQIEFISSLCPDGTPKTKDVECPGKNGCFHDKPIRCADGLCVANTNECFTPKCNFNKPVQCEDGNCVTQATDCNLVNSLNENYDSCTKIGLKGYYMCADGICVSSPEFCRPIFDCPEGLSKCSDGTCRNSGGCPEVAESCPELRKEKCNDGRCKKDAESCTTLDICPKGQIHCKDKSCVNSLKDCLDIKSVNPRSCTFNEEAKLEGYRCLDGRCMEKKEDCFSVDPACTIDSPILCPDGTCKEKYSECNNIGCDSDNKIRCPNKLCVEKSKYMVSCKNELGCPLIKPYRCYDGTCVEKYETCPTIVKCPPSKPFICADYRCVQKKSFCNRSIDCPVDFFKCPKNGLCVKLEKDCKDVENNCPILSPIRCLNGLCVSDLSDCQNSYLIPNCKEGEFFCALKAQCLKNKSDCIGLENAKGGESSTNRLLQFDIVTVPENNCTAELPFSCFDGTCRKFRSDCPLPNSCLPGEFKCPDSKCVKNKSNCNKEITCLDGYVKCDDGICRKYNMCRQFNGCPKENPYQCYNGRCVKNHVECMGYSMCSSGHFRCFNGECQKDPKNCEEVLRLYNPLRQTITASTYNRLETDLVLDNNGRTISSLYIPANSFNLTEEHNSDYYVDINIREVPHSTLRNLDYNYEQLDYFQFWIDKTIKDSDGDLTFENSVLSPIIQISSNWEKKLKQPAILKMEHNKYISKDITHENYCLAKLVHNKWRCFDTMVDNKNSLCNQGGRENEYLCGSRKKKEDQDSFAIDSFGIYAVVLIPVNKLEQKVYVKNIFFENLKLVIISAIVTALVVFILYHIFQRILRYRTKYLENKKKIQFKQEAVSDMMNIKLEFPGATVGDITDKIQFIPNPAFKFIGVNKDPLKQKEEEIDRMSAQATSIDKINAELILEIEKIRDEYNEIRRMVEKTKANQ